VKMSEIQSGDPLKAFTEHQLRVDTRSRLTPMGNQRTEIDDNLRAFIQGQRMFFVATAPLDAGGYINLSPKGLDTLRILNPTKVAYLDHVGSGSETIAHVKENGRIVLMWCAFEGPPNILRLHGRGEVLAPHDMQFQQLRPLFPATPGGGRAIIVVTVERIATSCGFGVPAHSPERAHYQDLSGLVIWPDVTARRTSSSACKPPGAAPPHSKRVPAGVQ
jgi:Pyridoxamine 5'-phosphate oxidase